MTDAQLVAAFVARQPLSDVSGLARELAELVARSRSEAPSVTIDDGEFVGYIADRIGPDPGALRSLHAGALRIACGCVLGQPDALAAFEREYAPAIREALTRAFDPGLAQDAELALRERLFLVAADDRPRLASYSGHGNLRAWLRAAAVRGAIDLMRARRPIPTDPNQLGDVLSDDPLLAQLKQRYRDEFRTAFATAAGGLNDRDRTLLRYRFADDLSIDEIGKLYGAHRATVARWLAAIREGLFERTRLALMAQLEVDESDVDSVLRLIDSRLDASLSEIVR